MGKRENIIIGDESALHLYLHINGIAHIGARTVANNPLTSCAATSEALSMFNTTHPLYGGEPVCLLVDDARNRRASSLIRCRCCTFDLPRRSFIELRHGLFATSPQLTFARLALGHSIPEIVNIGLDLCARYFTDLRTMRIETRESYLVTPAALRRYLEQAPGLRGSTKALKALRWVVPNSGSPMESKTWVLFRLPLRYGGFNIPFDAMNFDIKAGRLAALTSQRNYSIDIVCSDNRSGRIGLEYDGAEWHTDASKDKKRRNELAALGWTVLPIDWNVLNDPDATERTAYQIARKLGLRLRKPRGWESRHIRLRNEIGL